MRQSTKASIDAKIARMTDDNYYEWYQLFHNAGATNREEIVKYYIEEITKKFGKPNKLQEVFETIYRGDGLEINDTENFRKSNEFKLSLRGKDCNNEIISKETYIQRNIYVNSPYYEKELGHIFGYEVTFVRKTRLAPVDLVSYDFDGEKLKFNLIELKACNAIKIKHPAKDLLLRALFEVVTYKAYFEKVLAYNDELSLAIQKQLKEKLPNVTIDAIKEASIKLIILAPDYIIDEKDNELMKDFLNPEKIRLLSISPTSKFDENVTVGLEGKLFNIK